MDRKYDNIQDLEREMRRLIERDPIPKLSETELSGLAERVLRGDRIPRPLMWFDLRPAFKAALGVAVVLIAVFVGFLVRSGPELIMVEYEENIDEIFEKRQAEEILADAIVSGELEMQFALGALIDVPLEDVKNAVYVITPSDLDSQIENLSDKEAEEILKILDKMGYPDRET